MMLGPANAKTVDVSGQTDKVSHVMLNGLLYEADTLNEIITGDRKTMPFYWQ